MSNSTRIFAKTAGTNPEAFITGLKVRDLTADRFNPRRDVCADHSLGFEKRVRVADQEQADEQADQEGCPSRASPVK